ncbi:MAG: glucose-6-phosphate dehydrogenase, partial [Bosea sp. (in: a-proteobacteria)]
MVSRVIPVETFDLVIFGGTGDLARRKILPGLFRRFLAGQMPPQARIIGAARADLTSVAFREMVAASISEFGGTESGDAAAVAAFQDRLEYVAIDATGVNGWTKLAQLVRKDVVRAFYFSVAPALFGALAERLHEHGI